MKKNVLFLIIILITFFTAEKNALAGRPLSTDDAYTVCPRHLQIEMAAEHLKESSNEKETSVSATLTTGVIWDRLDFAVGVPYLWEDPNEGDNSNGFGDLAARFKLRFLDETDKCPAMAFTAGVKAETGNCDEGLGSGTTDFNFNMIATKCVNKFTFHVNAGYRAIGDLAEDEEGLCDYINLGIAGEYAFTDKFSLVGEVYSEIATESTDENNPVDVLIGGKYTLPCGTVLDGAVAIGLTDGAPDYRITAGFTHVF